MNLKEGKISPYQRLTFQEVRPTYMQTKYSVKIQKKKNFILGLDLAM